MKPFAGKGDHVLLRVRVKPRSSRNAVSVTTEGTVCVALTAAPHDGEANDALRSFLAKCLGVAKSRVTLVGGEKSREKLLRIDGLDEEQVRAGVYPR